MIPELIPVPFEGLGKFIGIIVTFFGGIAGIYLLAVIMKWVYNIRILKTLKDIKEELEILNNKKKGKNETKGK